MSIVKMTGFRVQKILILQFKNVDVLNKSEYKSCFIYYSWKKDTILEFSASSLQIYIPTKERYVKI